VTNVALHLNQANPIVPVSQPEVERRAGSVLPGPDEV